jgi:NADH:ubiquinone oxidoreductase subunit D
MPSTGKDKKLDKYINNNWQIALSDARRSLFETQQRVRTLQQSIRIIEKKIATGELWPGESESSATHN